LGDDERAESTGGHQGKVFLIREGGVKQEGWKRGEKADRSKDPRDRMKNGKISCEQVAAFA